MKNRSCLPHLSPDATKENIIKLAVDAEKGNGSEHIIFAFVGLGLDKVVDTTKQFSKFAR
jgi:hypothetical protein